MQPTRPPGVNVVMAFFATFAAIGFYRLLIDVDLHVYRFIVNYRIPDLVIALLSVVALVGLARMRTWGRYFAIGSSATIAATVLAVYAVILSYRLWTLLPRPHWVNARYVFFALFGIFNVWYLMRPSVRDAFRQ
jgi:hypothetical protein